MAGEWPADKSVALEENYYLLCCEMVWWICLEGKPKEETRFPLMRQANVASGMGQEYER